MEESIFYSLDSEQQVLLAALLAIIVSENLNENQLNILGNFVEAVGQNIIADPSDCIVESVHDRTR